MTSDTSPAGTLPRRYLPLPAPYTGGQVCQSCTGTGVTGRRCGMHSGTVIIVVDELCPTCGGCGRGPDHVDCAPIMHADWDPEDADLSDEQWEKLQGTCQSCYGRRWNPVLAFPPGGESMSNLRVPCGCAETLMVPAGDDG